MTAVRPLEISEAAFQTRVMDYAKYRGWKVVHYRTAILNSGRRATALSGDKGAPDLILAKNGRVLLVELKRDSGRVKPEQQEWLAALGENGRLWRPRDWAQIEQELR
jgi:HJR/Mrr/RecB family endonuclease